MWTRSKFNSKTYEPTRSVDCVQIIFLLFPIESTHHFSVSSFAKLAVYLSIKFSDSACDILVVYKEAMLYQSLVVSIETIKSNMNTIQIWL